MKKNIVIALIGTMILGLCACEKTQKGKDSSEPVKTVVTEETSKPKDKVKTKFVNDGNTVFCDMSGMSSQDIYDNLMNTKSFADGTVYGDYMKKFDSGNGTFARDEDSIDAWDYVYADSSAKITRIGLVGLYPFDPDLKTTNDTALHAEKKAYIYITFVVTDLDTGNEIYNKFMDYYATIGTTSESDQFGLLHGSVKVEEGIFFSVTLQTDDQGPYRMSVEVPCYY